MRRWYLTGMVIGFFMGVAAVSWVEWWCIEKSRKGAPGPMNPIPPVKPCICQAIGR